MEQNKRACKSCKVLKDRIEDGKFPDAKNKKWRDAEGGLWNGSECNSCFKIRLKEHMKSKRKPNEHL